MTPYIIALAALALLLLRQKFNNNADTETHSFSLLRHTTEKINAKKQNNRKKEDEQ